MGVFDEKEIKVRLADVAEIAAMCTLSLLEEKTRFGDLRTLSHDRSTNSVIYGQFWSDHHAASTLSA